VFWALKALVCNQSFTLVLPISVYCILYLLLLRIAANQPKYTLMP